MACCTTQQAIFFDLYDVYQTLNNNNVHYHHQSTQKLLNPKQFKMEAQMQKAIDDLFNSSIDNESAIIIANAIKNKNTYAVSTPKVKKLSKEFGLKFNHSAENIFEAVGLDFKAPIEAVKALISVMEKSGSKNSEVFEYMLDADYEGKAQLITMILLKGLKEGV